MSEFLSEAWLEQVLGCAADLPGLKGMSATVNFEVKVSQPKSATKRFQAVLEDGRLTELAQVKSKEEECRVICSADELKKIVTGEVGAEVAFMQGWLKIRDDDDGVLLFKLRPLYGQAEWQQFKQAVADLTE